MERNYFFTTRLERRIVGDMKEKYGHIAVDYETEMKSNFLSNKDIETGKYTGKNYELPDGQPIFLEKELFTGP